MSHRHPHAYDGVTENAPKSVHGGMYVAELTDEEPVLFLIGMRINRWWKVWEWFPAWIAMPMMLIQLKRLDAGLLGDRLYWSGRVFMVVQYWRSAKELGDFAHNPDLKHVPAWRKFNRGASNASVGVFHETYILKPETVESLYANMPPFGLALAHSAVTRYEHKRNRANERIGSTDPATIA